LKSIKIKSSTFSTYFKVNKLLKSCLTLLHFQDTSFLFILTLEKLNFYLFNMIEIYKK